MTTVALVLFTYSPTVDGPRAQYAEQTLRRALDMVSTSGRLTVHIADDGSPQEYRDKLFLIAGGYPAVHDTSVSNSERRGYGASYNLATQFTHDYADAVLALEDDWLLPYPLDLDPYLEALRSGLGCIRLGRLGYTDDLHGRLCWVANQHYLILDPHSPEKHVFVGGPRIESVAFERRMGPWPEGLRAGETELSVCGRDAARRGVALPIPDGIFEHIGTIPTQELTG